MTRPATLVLLSWMLMAGQFAMAFQETSADKHDEQAEPLQRFTVVIGDRKITVAQGETIQLEGNFSNPQLKIVPHSHRTFQAQGVTFDYPTSFVFEADLTDPTAKSWIFSGNDFLIMYFALQGDVTPEAYVQDMIAEFGTDNAKVINPNATIKLGDHEISGQSMIVSVASHRMQMDVYRIPTPNGNTRLLVFQDSIDENNSRTNEGRSTLRTLQSTFQVK